MEKKKEKRKKKTKASPLGQGFGVLGYHVTHNIVWTEQRPLRTCSQVYVQPGGRARAPLLSHQLARLISLVPLRAQSLWIKGGIRTAPRP